MLTAVADIINIFKQDFVGLCAFCKAGEESGTAFSCLSARNNATASGRIFVDRYV